MTLSVNLKKRNKKNENVDITDNYPEKYNILKLHLRINEENDGNVV